MEDVKKIRCPFCNKEFIPPTIYPLQNFHYDGRSATYPLKDTPSKLMTEEGFFPSKIIIVNWITFCPECGFELKFIKEIVNKIKKTHINLENPNISYEKEEFKKPFKDYSDYFRDVEFILKEDISYDLIKDTLKSLEKIYLNSDDFKFLIKIIAYLEDYYNEIKGINNKYMPEKIKELNFPEELEDSLINCNALRNNIVHKNHEMTIEEKELIHNTYCQIILYFIKSTIIPIVDKIHNQFKFINKKNILEEAGLIISPFLNKLFRDDKDHYNRLDKIFLSLTEDFGLKT
ncbi:MAG: hypothetical protein JXA99_08430 [Candidatus Lokiarchaeota archaeon]|nr:hypothetical protein [Candidatus Lokiarchaeota archaeon]